jgi:hypothetical protein
VHYVACARGREYLAHSRLDTVTRNRKCLCTYQQGFVFSWRADRLWKPPRFPFGAYSMLLPAGKAADSIPSQVKNEWRYTFITPYAFMACIKETFAFNAWGENPFSPAPYRRFSVWRTTYNGYSDCITATPVVVRPSFDKFGAAILVVAV